LTNEIAKIDACRCLNTRQLMGDSCGPCFLVTCYLHYTVIGRFEEAHML